jgi:hypothetical protein
MSDLRFSPRDWERVEGDALAWWAGELDRPLVWLAGSDPDVARPFAYMTN